MKKKTNVQTRSEGKEVKPRRQVKPRQHGPQKEKTQITIRVDTNLMTAAYRQMQHDNTRITDIVERGLILALTESKQQLPVWSTQVRFMVANATKDQQVLIRGLLIAMVEPLLDPKERLERRTRIVDGKQRTVYIIHKPSWTPETAKFYELMCWFLKLRNESMHAPAALEFYSRYGKSAEEMAELASLKTAGS